MFNINLEGMLEVLPNAGFGWLGIFIVTLIIIFVIWLLDVVTRKKK